MSNSAGILAAGETPRTNVPGLAGWQERATMPAAQRTSQNTATYFLLVPNVMVRGGPGLNYWFTAGARPTLVAYRPRCTGESVSVAHSPIGGDAGE